jgi:hypothetical protein
MQITGFFTNSRLSETRRAVGLQVRLIVFIRRIATRDGSKRIDFEAIHRALWPPNCNASADQIVAAQSVKSLAETESALQEIG